MSRLLLALLLMAGCPAAGHKPGDSESETDVDGDGVMADVDCDDADAAVGAASTRYTDADGDGYGDDATGVASCTESGVAEGGDCDDGDAAVSPAGVEVCDAADTDEDCDGLVDDADDGVDPSGKVEAWQDADGDG